MNKRRDITLKLVMVRKIHILYIKHLYYTFSIFAIFTCKIPIDMANFRNIYWLCVGKAGKFKTSPITINSVFGFQIFAMFEVSVIFAYHKIYHIAIPSQQILIWQ